MELEVQQYPNSHQTRSNRGSLARPNHLANERGASMVEYVVLIGSLTLSLILAIPGVTDSSQSNLESAAVALNGGPDNQPATLLTLPDSTTNGPGLVTEPSIYDCANDGFDLNGDYLIGEADLGLFLANWSGGMEEAGQLGLLLSCWNGPPIAEATLLNTLTDDIEEQLATVSDEETVDALNQMLVQINKIKSPGTKNLDVSSVDSNQIDS